jgi:hypothetical protein
VNGNRPEGLIRQKKKKDIFAFNYRALRGLAEYSFIVVMF